MLEIISATWGYFGMEYNVTDIVRGLIVNDTLTVPASNGVFNDPCPYFVKDLKIAYSYKGSTSTIVIQERPGASDRILSIIEGKATASDDHGLIKIKIIS